MKTNQHKPFFLISESKGNISNFTESFTSLSENINEEHLKYSTTQLAKPQAIVAKQKHLSGNTGNFFRTVFGLYGEETI